ncbi:hypothetical protein [Bradyrhizobium guangzhouense]|uniref:Uncharacterized protein n=1 Tax=Bradyrhizobium guangzhouense TaxID=1325095 RepID=A0AAE5WZ88_9BRAD|nr:hypothetical protein [Bradyrhizobium guangzhouense]QAU45898.1 hypothetical protein XH91_11380 [Bradyrhizobium guangzhouense]
MTTSRSAQAAADAIAARDIFAGRSRTHNLIDPAIAAEMMGKSRGAAVRTAYEVGQPLTVRAAINLMPDRFRNADLSSTSRRE